MHPSLIEHLKTKSNISAIELGIISNSLNERRFLKNQYVIQTGQSAPSEYFVVKGCLRAFFVDEQGKEHIVQFATENWWISDFKAYFTKGTAQHNIHCLEDCILLELSLSDRERLWNEFHSVSEFFRKQLTGGFVALQRRVQSYLSRDTKARYHAFLKQYPDLSQRIPKKHIASFLGVSRETLSRLEH